MNRQGDTKGGIKRQAANNCTDGNSKEGREKGMQLYDALPEWARRIVQHAYLPVQVAQVYELLQEADEHHLTEDQTRLFVWLAYSSEIGVEDCAHPFLKKPAPGDRGGKVAAHRTESTAGVMGRRRGPALPSG